MEVINHHPQLVKKVELLVELGIICLPDAAEAQQVRDRREEHREDLLPVMSKDSNTEETFYTIRNSKIYIRSAFKDPRRIWEKEV